MGWISAEKEILSEAKFSYTNQPVRSAAVNYPVGQFK